MSFVTIGVWGACRLSCYFKITENKTPQVQQDQSDQGANSDAAAFSSQIQCLGTTCMGSRIKDHHGLAPTVEC